MEQSKSQKIVKVLGILSIIGAVLGLVGALALFGVGGAGAANAGDAMDDQLAVGVASVFLLGIILLIGAIVNLVQGIFSLRAAKDATKAGPLWVISIISVVLNVFALINSFGQGGQETGSAVFSLIISAVVFYLANDIKKQGQGM